MPKLTRKQLAKLITDWNIIAKSTLDCRTCDKFYETPFEWLGKKEREAFIDHVYDFHVMRARTSKKKKKSYKKTQSKQQRIR